MNPLKDPHKYIAGAIWICLVVTLFIGQASAWTDSTFTADTQKTIDLNTKTNYGVYTIEESKWWDILQIWTKEPIKTIVLESNTDSCGQNCKAQMRFNLLKDGVLIEDSKFLDVEDKMKETTIRSSSVWIWDNPKTGTESYLDNVCTYTEEEEKESCSNVLKERSYYYKLVDDYEYVCEKTGELSKNGTAIEECRNEVVGQKEYRYDGWVQYNIGYKVSAGEYLVEFRGNKPFDKEIDWQIKVDGIWTSAWAIWGFTDMTNGLVAQYRANTQNFTLNNQTQVLDFTGSNNGTLIGKTFNDGTVSGGVTIEDGAMKFDGVDDYVNLNSNLGSNISTQLTYSAWVYAFNTNNLIRNRDNSYIRPSGAIVRINNTLQTELSIPSGDRILNQWNHLVYVVDSQTGEQKLYQNGILYKNGSISQGIINVSSAIGDWVLGRRFTGAEYFNGSIDDVRIYNRALSQDEITQLYNQGRGQYSSVTNGLVFQASGRDYEGTAEAPTTIYDTNHLGDGKVNQSLSFDGVDDWVNLSTLDAQTLFEYDKNYSISGWFNSLHNSSDATKIILGSGNGTASKVTIGWDYGRLRVRYRTSGSTTVGASYETILNSNQWYHYSFNYYGNGTGELYFNGEKRTGTTALNSVGNNGVILGSRNDLAGDFNGSLDDVRIYNRTLSTDEIAYLYNSGMGREDSSDAWIVLNSPFDDQVIYTNQVTTNATAYVESGAYLTNASLNLSVNGGAWGVVNTTTFSLNNILPYSDFNATLKTDLEAYYKLDETSGTNVINEVGTNGTNSGVTVNQEGILNTGYNFSGNDGVEINLNGNLNLGGTTAMTFSVWVKVNDTTRSNGFIGENTDDANWLNFLGTGEHLDFMLGSTNLRASSTIIEGEWAHYVATYNGTTMRLYKNGTSIANGTGYTGVLSNGGIIIGTERGLTGRNMKGLIDEVGVWSRALSDSEVLELYEGSGYSEKVQTFTNTYSAGDVVDWKFNFDDSDGDTGISEIRRFTIDPTAPTISLAYPTSLIDYGKLNGSLQLNFTATDTNLDSVWYDYNGTNVTIAGAVSGVYNQTNITLSTKKNITIYANDTAGNLYSEVFGWDYKVFENSRTYNATTIATSLEPFYLNLTYNSTKYYGLSANLVYNGTSYLATKTSTTNNVILTNSINVPNALTATNYSFYWDITLTELAGDTSISTGTSLQLVTPMQTINVTSATCGAGFYPAFNFTFYDEANLSATNATLVNYNFKYGVGISDSLIADGSLSNIPSFNICINATSEYTVGYGEVQYEATGYSSRRFYIFNSTRLTNTTIANNLYMLDTASSSPFQITATRTNLNPYDNNYISLLRWYPSINQYNVVDMGKTDDKGQTVVNVKTNDVDYRLGLYEDDGTLIKLLNPIRMVCLTNPCTYSLLVSETETDLTTFLNVQNSLTYDETAKTYTFIWSDPSQNTVSMNLLVYKDYPDRASTVICNQTADGFTGIIVCDVSAFSGDFRAEAWRMASPWALIAKSFNSARAFFKDSEGGRQTGLFFGFVLVVLFATMGAFSPVLVIIMSIIALIPLVALGIFSLTVFMIIGAIGGVILWFLRRSSGQ